MAINIKFTKFDNTPWGFRLAGGSDFPQPLTVIRVTEGSLGECMGLKVGDVVVRLNDQSIINLTHGQAHEALVHAGNNFVLGVQREEEARKAAEAISEETIVPYKIALADLPPVFPEQILKEETVIERYEEENIVVEPLSAEDEIRKEEEKLEEEKPVDANSEIVANKNLTDDEIAQLILEEEELLSDKGLLGVNFKKLRPRASILKDSKVLEELQNIAIAEPERVQELKRTSTFLQKPQRPIPKVKNEPKVEEDEGETYKVVIKKQDKKTVIARLVEKGLLPPGSESTIIKTPEPPEPSEVKMHETENKLEENHPLAVSDSNSSCSTCSSNNNSLLSQCPSESDSNEFLISEDQLAHCETHKCKSEQCHVKPSHSRRYSTTRYDEVGARSLFKGRYLENLLRGYTRSCILRDRQVDEFANTKSESVYLKKYDGLKNIGLDGFSSSETKRRTSRCARAHYVERILLQNVSAVVTHFRPKPKTTRVFASRMKGRYLATYLRRKSLWLMSLITTLFQFLLQRPSISESSNLSKIHERRLSFKGRYLEHVLQKNVAPVLECVKETCFIDDQLKMIEKEKEELKSTRTKGYYMEKCLYRQNRRLKFVLNLLDYVKSSLDNLFAIIKSSRMKSTMKGRYVERLIRRNLEILELFVEYIRSRISEWLGDGLSCTSRNDFPVATVGISNDIVNDLILNEQETDNDAPDLKISEWHEDSPVCSLQKESPLIINTSNNPDPVEEKTTENDRQILECNSNPVLFEEVNECTDLTKPTDVAPEDTVSKFLQSAENYVSAEVFHRGSRRLSKSRKSIDTSKEDDKALSKFLQSAEDYVSAEVFHRGSRRVSKSRKSIDTSKEDDKALSKFLQSAEDYVSAEVFHRGSRRLSRPRKSVDITSKEDDETLSKFLQSAENYVSAEVFHRAEDYVSAEVFHRGSRRLSRSHKREEQGEEDVLSSVLRSTGDYVSSEVFHRGSRRLSRSFRRESVSLAPTLWDGLKNMHLNLPWFSFRITKKSTKHIEDYEEVDSEIELDNRRLSFVPTILYQGITNCIGIDFTKFVVYAFIPSTQEFVCRAEQEGKSDSRPASKAEETEEKKSDEVDEIEAKERPEFKEEDRPESCKARLTQDEQTVAEEDSSVSISDPVAVKTNNKEKIKQLVSTEISLEQQLENVQRQLLALKQLPSEIENHLKIVSEQLHMIMELSGVQRSFGNGNGGCRGLSEENSMLRQKDEEELKQQEEDTDEEDEEFTETYDYIEEIACLERRTSSRSTPQVIESSDDEGEMEEEEAETKELDGMISVKSAEEGSRVKKFIVSYETKVLKSPSPAPSHGSFEPDPKLSPKDQVIQELQERVHKKGKKHSQELWPQAKQLELTQGRRWRCPNDFFNDEMIAEVLTCQAEVIRGKAMGVNFKKYEKTNLPNYDYLMNSSVYKMIHKMEREPKRGIPVRPAKVNAAEDIIERVKSPALSIIDDRSARSVSH
ncbi:PDZ and LIM domain protein Zasp [Trachymyrmex septentrionalis]|uniref:PDZ and LIM domain protein Zasp n=1 Tax=Trachymyrmex septentrionalis TaxID=34720 RepID=A0A195F1F0_9HYME|nr:PDZ and LIM domain protein Zasp [Trachymyrmex septentrionalis]